MENDMENETTHEIKHLGQWKRKMQRIPRNLTVQSSIIRERWGSEACHGRFLKQPFLERNQGLGFNLGLGFRVQGLGV